MRKKLFICGALALILIGLSLRWAASHSWTKKSLGSIDLGEGRILQIEGVTYGTSHKIGDARSAVIRRFRPWLPKTLVDLLEPRHPQSTIDHLDRPALVIWVNAIDPTTKSNVDCQGIRVELTGKQGDLFGEETSSWFGHQHFWRVGHLFYVFPRTERTLTMRVTSWKNKHSARLEFPNPNPVEPAVWNGEALPKTNRAGDLDIVLAQLKIRTNGTPEPNDWEAKSVYWEPIWELRGKGAGQWEAPEWTAEDPTGNKGRQLGVHQPILRFSGLFYPSPTNQESAQLIATLPAVRLTNSQPTVRWDKTFHFGTNEISALGFFPPGNYVFSDGFLLTNPPVKMGAVRGGAPSGWTGQSVTVSPVKVKNYHGHYSTTNSVFYLRAPNLGEKKRLAIRLRDEKGGYWLTKLEPQGASEGIYPFLVNLPIGAEEVVAEVVVLKPVEAEFTVKVPEIH